VFEGKGLFIDKQNNRYKKYVSVLFFKVGEWKKLPEITFVAITKVKGNQTMEGRGGMATSATLKIDLFCVYLCIDQKRKILVKKTKKKNEAIILAKGAADYLKVSLSNYLKEN
jgi:hypothetical protein